MTPATPLLRAIARHGLALVFGNVFLEQLGLPIPAFPLFVVAGSLIVGDAISGPGVLGAVLAATLLADTVWFFLGRRFGWHILRLLCGLTISADSCVKQMGASYDRWGLRSLLFAKFVPGLSAVATPLSGAMGAPYVRFLGWDAAGTLIWCGAGIGLGAVFHQQVGSLLLHLQEMGGRAIVVALAALGAVIAVKAVARWRSLRTLRMARITVSELKQGLEEGAGRVVLDVRNRMARKANPTKIPGAIVVDLGELDEALRALPRDKEAALYCT